MLNASQFAPAFHLANLEGDTSSLQSYLERGPVLLAFFKASCPTCQFTFPFLERLAAGGAPVVGIGQDKASVDRKFREEFALHFPVLIDDAGYPVSNAFAITHVPSIFLVEPDGQISAAWSGFSRSDMEEAAQRFHVPLFHRGEQVPAFKPG